jgi:predicted dehydrogenase
MARLRLAVIGVGHLGKEHARILAGLSDVELVGVVDVNVEQAKAVAQAHGSTAYNAYWPLLNLVDAAVIAVPTIYHHAIASDFLCRGIPLLVEKPLAASPGEAEALVALARRYGTMLQVGHIERYNPAFEELQRRPLQPKLIDGQRVGPFTGRSTDIGAVLDLMIHDIDLVLTLVKAPVVGVEAVGASVFGGHEDLVHARLTFADGCIANLAASRVNPQPQRRMQVWAPEGYAGIDFATRRLTLVQPSQALRSQGLDVRRLSPSGRAGLKDELFTSHLQTLELDCNRGDQLTRELQDFVTCVSSKQAPRVSGADGASAIAVAGRILESLRLHRWDARHDGPAGPVQLPAALGPLFPIAEPRRAA